MRISISNIAWDRNDDEQVVSILHKLHVDAIDIAPGKFFDSSMTPTDAEIQEVKEWWNSRGIELVGMQALLFGTTGLNVFNPETHTELLNHLEKVCRIAAGLNIKKLTFGSPKNRDLSGLDSSSVERISLQFFALMGDLAKKWGVIFCLEPNPTIYSCNFLTTTTEAANFVTKLNHPNVKLQLDSGTIITNRENFEVEFETYKHLIGHVHASDTNLVPIRDHSDYHKSIASKLKSINFPLATIEMLTNKSANPLSDIQEAVEFALRIYK